MKALLKYPLVFEVIFFLIIFCLATAPILDFDIWFHIKSGEIISQMGIIHYDVFSHSAGGRQWYPYEWLFQITVYFIQQIFGFESIKYFLASVVAIQIAIFYSILRYILSLNKLSSMLLSFFFFVSVYEFITPRPHIPAYTFLIANLFLILLYFLKNKNLLWISIPITLAWANLHGSIFVNVLFFLSYTFVALVNFKILKDNLWLRKFKVLGIYTIVTALLTILPPLGLTQYKLLLLFFQEREFISHFIEEWAPLGIESAPLIYYSLILTLTLLAYLWKVIKKKGFKTNIWILPLFPLTFTVFLASRNIFLSYISLVIILAYSISDINIFAKKQTRLIAVIFLILFLGFNFWLIWQKKIPSKTYYPALAVKFIKDNNIKGNLFNEYGHGGYLLYHLYPKQKVFIDGRTDIYLCCEMKDILELAIRKNQKDEDYKIFLEDLWNKYQISYVLLHTQKHSVSRRIANILNNDPTWSLVFWDDNSQLFIRKDGKNKDTIEKWDAIEATPYLKDPYRKDISSALREYQTMSEIAPSAKSYNAIGFIYLNQNRFDEAKEEFEKAIKLDPSNESPYMNYAELALANGFSAQAIKLYEQAGKLAPDRGLIYIRLGQLYLQYENNPSKARTIWQEGVKKTVDDDAKDKLKELLSRLSN